jgi:O-acetyl-ADP-ribose deacetylase (regulator of RNase III)
LIRKAFEELPDVEALVYEPAGAPAASQMRTRTKRPKMTPGRAVVLGLINQYLATGYFYRLSLLEVQKLAYFMQYAGENLNLDFRRGAYGPYADKLRHVLNYIEGHFIIGFGDGNNRPDTRICPVPDALHEADELLAQHADVKKRFERVADLIEGFETPYGMELISSVHWVATQEDQAALTDPDAAIAGVHNWSPRKRKLLKSEHIRIAWTQLSEKGWLRTFAGGATEAAGPS